MERKADFKNIKKLWCEQYLLGEAEMVISCLTRQHWEGLEGSEVLPSLQFHGPEFSVIQLGFRCHRGTCFPGLGDQKDMNLSCLLVLLQFTFLFAKSLS